MEPGMKRKCLLESVQAKWRQPRNACRRRKRWGCVVVELLSGRERDLIAIGSPFGQQRCILMPCVNEANILPAPQWHTKRGWHCEEARWRRVGISYRAAQNYIETYYLQLKATQVSLIYTKHHQLSLWPTQPGAPLRIWRERPLLFVKRINPISESQTGRWGPMLLSMLVKEEEGER